MAADLNTPRQEAAAAAYGGSVYVVGGWNGTSIQGTAEYFDLEAGSWTTLASKMFVRRISPSAVVIPKPQKIAVDLGRMSGTTAIDARRGGGWGEGGNFGGGGVGGGAGGGGGIVGIVTTESDLLNALPENNGGNGSARTKNEVNDIRKCNSGEENDAAVADCDKAVGAAEGATRCGHANGQRKSETVNANDSARIEDSVNITSQNAETKDNITVGNAQCSNENDDDDEISPSLKVLKSLVESSQDSQSQQQQQPQQQQQKQRKNSNSSPSVTAAVYAAVDARVGAAVDAAVGEAVDEAFRESLKLDLSSLESDDSAAVSPSTTMDTMSPPSDPSRESPPRDRRHKSFPGEDSVSTNQESLSQAVTTIEPITEESEHRSVDSGRYSEGILDATSPCDEPDARTTTTTTAATPTILKREPSMRRGRRESVANIPIQFREPTLSPPPSSSSSSKGDPELVVKEEGERTNEEEEGVVSSHVHQRLCSQMRSGEHHQLCKFLRKREKNDFTESRRAMPREKSFSLQSLEGLAKDAVSAAVTKSASPVDKKKHEAGGVAKQINPRLAMGGGEDQMTKSTFAPSCQENEDENVKENNGINNKITSPYGRHNLRRDSAPLFSRQFPPRSPSRDAEEEALTSTSKSHKHRRRLSRQESQPIEKLVPFLRSFNEKYGPPQPPASPPVLGTEKEMSDGRSESRTPKPLSRTPTPTSSTPTTPNIPTTTTSDSKPTTLTIEFPQQKNTSTEKQKASNNENSNKSPVYKREDEISKNLNTDKRSTINPHVAPEDQTEQSQQLDQPMLTTITPLETPSGSLNLPLPPPPPIETSIRKNLSLPPPPSTPSLYMLLPLPPPPPTPPPPIRPEQQAEDRVDLTTSMKKLEQMLRVSGEPIGEDEAAQPASNRSSSASQSFPLILVSGDQSATFDQERFKIVLEPDFGDGPLPDHLLADGDADEAASNFSSTSIRLFSPPLPTPPETPLPPPPDTPQPPTSTASSTPQPRSGRFYLVDMLSNRRKALALSNESMASITSFASMASVEFEIEDQLHELQSGKFALPFEVSRSLTVSLKPGGGSGAGNRGSNSVGFASQRISLMPGQLSHPASKTAMKHQVSTTSLKQNLYQEISKSRNRMESQSEDELQGSAFQEEEEEERKMTTTKPSTTPATSAAIRVTPPRISPLNPTNTPTKTLTPSSTPTATYSDDDDEEEEAKEDRDQMLQMKMQRLAEGKPIQVRKSRKESFEERKTRDVRTEDREERVDELEAVVGPEESVFQVVVGSREPDKNERLAEEGVRGNNSENVVSPLSPVRSLSKEGASGPSASSAVGEKRELSRRSVSRSSPAVVNIRRNPSPSSMATMKRSLLDEILERKPAIQPTAEGNPTSNPADGLITDEGKLDRQNEQRKHPRSLSENPASPNASIPSPPPPPPPPPPAGWSGASPDSASTSSSKTKDTKRRLKSEETKKEEAKSEKTEAGAKSKKLIEIPRNLSPMKMASMKRGLLDEIISKGEGFLRRASSSTNADSSPASNIPELSSKSSSTSSSSSSSTSSSPGKKSKSGAKESPSPRSKRSEWKFGAKDAAAGAAGGVERKSPPQKTRIPTPSQNVDFIRSPKTNAVIHKGMTTGFFRKTPAAEEASPSQQRQPNPQQHSPNTLASMKRGLLDEVLQKARLPNGGLKSGPWKQVSSGFSPSTESKAPRTSGGAEGSHRKSGRETKDAEEKGGGSRTGGKGTKGKKVEMTIHLTKN